MKAGLRNIRALLELLGHPEHHYPSVHIAGTNGKGSTASMIASVLTASGYRTGLYTSPHLEHFGERIRIDGRPISPRELAVYARRLRPDIRRLRATFFEATTAIAFQLFRDRNVDVAVIESGLGGRLDATNVIRPLLSIITNISLEHTEHLGSTPGEIAFEKGGIIKPSVPCVTGTSNRAALEVLRAIAAKRNSELIGVSPHRSVRILSRSVSGLTISVKAEDRRYDRLKISLPGDHQGGNALLALVALGRLAGDPRFGKIADASVRRGLWEIGGYSGLRGRMDILVRRPLIIGDVAHNPDGMRTMSRSLEKLLPGPKVVVIGVLKDKDFRSMLDALPPGVRGVVAVTPRTERALDGRILEDYLFSKGRNALHGGSVSRGVRMALNEVRRGETVLITGSHYVVAEALRTLRRLKG